MTPDTVLDYDPSTGERHAPQAAAGARRVLPDDYVQTREWVTAADGAQIPISVVHHKSVTPRSDSPLLLYGYGSYEISYDPAMSISRLSLLDRGMVYVHAHVRGGGEMGRRWYEEGKLLAKKNTFTDFVDCARHLIDTGWTSPDKLVALGGSAGGLLMGAVANMAPELLGGIVAQVPFVDPLTTILDPSLPLSEIEWDEWGDPLHDPEVYAYMKSYTPYENISRPGLPADLRADLDQRHPGLLRRAGQVGSTAARHRAVHTRTSCSSARCRPATAAPAGGTTPGARPPTTTRGSSMWRGASHQPV